MHLVTIVSRGSIASFRVATEETTKPTTQAASQNPETPKLGDPTYISKLWCHVLSFLMSQ